LGYNVIGHPFHKWLPQRNQTLSENKPLSRHEITLQEKLLGPQPRPNVQRIHFRVRLLPKNLDNALWQSKIPTIFDLPPTIDLHKKALQRFPGQGNLSFQSAHEKEAW